MNSVEIEQFVKHGMIDVGTVRLHYVEAGSGPLVVLLHGFPEFWYSWRHQIPVLANAGYRAVAVDMRGYNLSDKPKGVDAYHVEIIAEDISKLIRGLGEERATVVGHDWGAAIAWIFASRHADQLDKLVIMNVAHPVVFLRALKTFRQLRRSWYMFLFQLPWLPEFMFRFRNYRAIRQVFRTDPMRPDAFLPEDIERYVEAMAQPGALTGGINYYRAAFRKKPAEIQSRMNVIQAPVLILWGEHDRYIGNEWAQPDAKWVPNARLERIADASHWVQCDRPDQVNALMIEFLKQP